MFCDTCKRHLSICECPGAKERIQNLIASDHVYVGNIIEERVELGLNQFEDFTGNIYHPFTMFDAPGMFDDTMPDRVELLRAALAKARGKET